MKDFVETIRSNFGLLEERFLSSSNLDSFCDCIPEYYSDSSQNYSDSARRFIDEMVDIKRNKFKESCMSQPNIGIKYFDASRKFDALLGLAVDIFLCENGQDCARSFDFKDYNDIRRDFIQKYVD